MIRKYKIWKFFSKHTNTNKFNINEIFIFEFIDKFTLDIRTVETITGLRIIIYYEDKYFGDILYDSIAINAKILFSIDIFENYNICTDDIDSILFFIINKNFKTDLKVFKYISFNNDSKV